MSATVVNVTDSTATTGTSLVVNMPTSPAVGNKLIMLLGFYQTAPSGGLTDWVLQEVVADTSSMRWAVYERIVSGSEPANYTVTGFTNNEPRVGRVIQLSGAGAYSVDASQQLDAAPYSGQSVTTDAADVLILTSAFSQATAAGNTMSWSGGTAVGSTVETAVVGGWRAYASTVSDVQASAGATTARTVTLGGTGWSANVAMVTLSVKPSAVAVNSSGWWHFFNGAPIGGSSSVTVTNRPTQPGLIAYDDSPATTYVSAWAHPGALVVVGRTNYNEAWVHTMADGGATVCIYLDAIIDNDTGRYHNKLINSSEFGDAVPNWPGSPTANEWGNLNDFRVGSVLHSKLPGVIDLIVDENPHISGLFLDDLGTRSWFPGFTWSSWSNTDKEAYRDGAIAVAQAVRAKADEHDLFVIVNGTWGATGTSGQGDGGYPTRGTHGCSLADGGTVEHHDPATEMSYWSAYAAKTGTQWGAATPRGLSYMFFLATNATDRAAWVAADLASHVQQSTDYDTIYSPWGGFTDFGLPHK